MVIGYELKQGEEVNLMWKTVSSPYVKGDTSRVLVSVEVRDFEGNLVKDLLNHGRE